MDDDITPLSVGNDDVPFTGPDPDDDELVSTRPETDSDIDLQEYYNEGLAGAAELGEDDMENPHLPDGFHIE